MADRGDLTVTALYTSHVWSWARFASAELFATREARDVFRVTNLVLALVRLVRPEIPLLKEGLAQRHAIIDRCLSESNRRSVIELAAGLSPRGASTSADPSIAYVEIDLPAVIAKKRELLGRNEEGRAILARTNLRLVEGDATSVDLAALAPDREPLCVIAEGFFMYLTAERQRALWSAIAPVVNRAGGELVFDLVPAVEQPKPGFVGRVLDRLFRRFTKGASFAFDERTRDDVVADLRRAGFGEVIAIEPRTAPSHWNLPHLGSATQQLVFLCRATGAEEPRDS
jgi:hypothetical protein